MWGTLKVKYTNFILSQVRAKVSRHKLWWYDDESMMMMMITMKTVRGDGGYMASDDDESYHMWKVDTGAKTSMRVYCGRSLVAPEAFGMQQIIMCDYVVDRSFLGWFKRWFSRTSQEMKFDFIFHVSYLRVANQSSRFQSYSWVNPSSKIGSLWINLT